MSKNWAICIGINNYNNLQCLKYAERDATAVKDFLSTQTEFDNIFLFTDNSPDIPTQTTPIPTRPTFGHLRRFLRVQFEKPQLALGDNLWFFFAGHGKRHNNRDYLMLADSDPGDIESTAVSVNYIVERLRRWESGNVILFLDACRDQSTRDGEGMSLEKHQGVITFYSCSPNEKSYEIDTLQHGSFTYALLGALRNESESNCATVERLANYLKNYVPILNQKHGLDKQTPYTVTEPISKLHHILLKKTATAQDIIVLKNEAYQAEIALNWELAHHLWTQVNIIASGLDMDAVQAFQRIQLQHPIGTSLKDGETISTQSSDFLSVGESPEFNYLGLFQVGSIKLPYIVIIGSWEQGVNEYRQGDIFSETISERFELVQDFRDNPVANYYGDDSKCRLVHHSCTITGGFSPNILRFVFSEIPYSYYLKTGEFLDKPLPSDSKTTFRDKYALHLDFDNLDTSKLSNICGVGVFVITKDKKIIVSKHSPHVRVNANKWGFAASGTMDWSVNVNPFNEIFRECKEEINHNLNLEETYLFAFGADTKRLYYQFSFFEYSNYSSEEVLKKSRYARDYYAEVSDLKAIDFDADVIFGLVKNQVWEPAAAAGLLILCIKEFGLDNVERLMNAELFNKHVREEMLEEWNRRAERPGSLAVMSTRFPQHLCEEESQNFTNAVLEFIDNDIDGKDVLELGAGIGRLTEKFILRAYKLTCIELSEKMLERNKSRLGSKSQQIKYLAIFAQDYVAPKKHDVVISSQVIAHNREEETFRSLISMIARSANEIFIFEQVDTGNPVSAYTRLRTREELINAFPAHKVSKQKEYMLFNDSIAFIKLIPVF